MRALTVLVLSLSICVDSKGFFFQETSSSNEVGHWYDRLWKSENQPMALAILMPLNISAATPVNRVLTNLHRWKKYSPCERHQSLKGKVQFIFQFGTVESETGETAKLRTNMRQLLSAFWKELDPAKECFGDSIRFLETSLLAGEEEDPIRSCATFYSLNEQLRNVATHFYLMGENALPIQRGWASYLYQKAVENVRCSKFWQAGSLTQTRLGDGRNAGLSSHLNKNSLYCLADSEYHKFLEKVRAFYPTPEKYSDVSQNAHGCITESEAHGDDGFDVAIFKFRIHPENRYYASRINHKFVHTKFIANFGEDPYDEAALKKDEDIFLVHSKFFYLPVIEQKRRKAYWNILRMHPSNPPIEGGEELKHLTAESLTRLEYKLCRHRINTEALVMDYNLEMEKHMCHTLRTLSFKEESDSIYCGERCAKEFNINHNYLFDSRMKEGKKKPFYFAIKAPNAESEENEMECLCFEKLCDNPIHHDLYNIYSAEIAEWPQECEQIGKTHGLGFKDQLYILDVDMHGGPILCQYDLFEELGAVVHAEIDFGVFDDRIRWKNHLLRNDEWRGFGLEPCPKHMRQRYYSHYKDDPWMQRVDMVICSHPSANCELFMPFADTKMILIYPTTRLEFGRNDEVVDWRKPYLDSKSDARWQEWVENLKLMHSRGAIVIANNLYDVHYIRHFTGIDAEYVPSWCDPGELYNPTRPEVLLGPYRDNLDFPQFRDKETWEHPILAPLRKALDDAKSRGETVPPVERIRKLYKTYTYRMLASHPAIIFIPYQTSVISFFEYYRMGIPIFAPSKSLLISWWLKHNILWERVYGQPSNTNKNTTYSDPNSNTVTSFSEWIEWADFYQFPHVQYFDSMEELVGLLQTVNLFDVSAKMVLFNKEEHERQKKQWASIFEKARQHISKGKRARRLTGRVPNPDLETEIRAALKAEDYKIMDDHRPMCRRSINKHQDNCLGLDQAFYSPSRSFRIRVTSDHDYVHEAFRGEWVKVGDGQYMAEGGKLCFGMDETELENSVEKFMADKQDSSRWHTNLPIKKFRGIYARKGFLPVIILLILVAGICFVITAPTSVAKRFTTRLRKFRTDLLAFSSKTTAYMRRVAVSISPKFRKTSD